MKHHDVIPVGIIVQRRRIEHPWKEWVWEAVGVLPWADPAVSWKLLTEEPDRVRFHAATLPLELHRGDTEAYVANLESATPAVYVVLRPDADGGSGRDVVPHHVTVSPYEAQHYLQSGDETVERLALPDALLAWVKDFTDAHHEAEVFVKRRRDRVPGDRVEDGLGDARIRQQADVYRAPTAPGRKRT